MKKLLLLNLLIIVGLSSFAQTTIRKDFSWNETPTTIRVGEDVIQQFEFEGAHFGDAAPSHPFWTHRFPISGPGELTVDILDIQYAAINKTAVAEDEQLDAQVRFYTSIVHDYEGYTAKIACVPLVKNGNQFQRVESFQLRVRYSPTAVARGGGTNVSVLDDGDIYKVAITETGMHKLSYDFLKNQLGISDLDNIDPKTIRVYGNGGGHVPYHNSVERPDDLTENAVEIVGGGDGSFDSGDYILMYAEGPHKWRFDATSERFSRETNIYDLRNYYFIKTNASGEGLRIASQESLNSSQYTSTGFDGLFLFEEDRVNVLHEIEEKGTGTGQHWYGDFFKIAREKTYNNLFNIQGLQANEPVILKAEMALRATNQSRFSLTLENQETFSSLAGSVPIGTEAEIHRTLAPTAAINDTIFLSNENVSVELAYPHPGGSTQSSGWLDYIQLRARMDLSLNGNQMPFRDLQSTGFSSTGFSLNNAGSGIHIWDISNPLVPKSQETTSAGNVQTFHLSTNNGLREFIAFNKEATLLSAEAVGKIPNQNLHGITGPDLLIIYHPDFTAPAEALAAHRANNSGFNVAMADINLVYNEFSSGRVDPTAIRDFARLLFMRDNNFKYLLLVGDGSFDARDFYEFGNNFIPVYERDRNHELAGFPSDDFFVIFNGDLDQDPLGHDMSVAVGRLPVNTLTEAQQVVDKIIQYDDQKSNLGDWRTRMVFVGDDEDSATHSDDADMAAELVLDTLSHLNSTKLFLDLFPQESTPAGDRYPRISEEMNRAIFKGVLAMTYLGHGGPRGWAQERILDIPTIQNWNNPNAIPIFITATCTFGGYDNGGFTSAGEELILNPTGGAIGLLTTTRPVFANRNSALTNASLANMLTRKSDGTWPTIGDVIREAKNGLSNPGSFDNERKFMLMGDPSMRPALPDFSVETITVNSKMVSDFEGIVDTIRALELVTITGRVTDLEGNLLSDFNGKVFPTIYDKRQPVNTLRNDAGSSPRTYMVQRNVLFKGQASVTNGEFSFSFVMPKDINYAFGPGKISYYASDLDKVIDAFGSFDSIVIGGTNLEGLTDDQGPLVEVFMNSDDFIAGSIVDPNPVLVAKLSDDLGINVSGNSIGHDLEGFLNENTQNSYLLNDFYESATDDYTKGEVRFPLNDLEPGTYSMRVRAWDVANNVGEGSTEFVVANDGKIALERVLNYPNPFTDRTCFQFDSGIAGDDLEVLIQIYTVSGRLVKTLDALIPSSDGALRLDDCIEWDGEDEYGDDLARGVYLYQVRVRSASNTDLTGESSFEKLVILK